MTAWPEAREGSFTMNVADIVVLIAAAIAIGGLGWFFFAPRWARAAELSGGVQRVTATVRGGYSPDVIRD